MNGTVMTVMQHQSWVGDRTIRVTVCVCIIREVACTSLCGNGYCYRKIATKLIAINF